MDRQCSSCGGFCKKSGCERENLKSTPQRQWVGLTHDEVNSWELPDCPTVFEFAQFIEAKLKEKNGYAEEKNT